MTVRLASIDAKTPDARRTGLKDRGTDGADAGQGSAFSGVLAGIGDAGSKFRTGKVGSAQVATDISASENVPSLASLFQSSHVTSTSATSSPLKNRTRVVVDDDSAQASSAADGTIRPATTPPIIDPAVMALHQTATPTAAAGVAAKSAALNPISACMAMGVIDKPLMKSASRNDSTTAAVSETSVETAGGVDIDRAEQTIVSSVHVETYLTVVQPGDRGASAAMSSNEHARTSVDVAASATRTAQQASSITDTLQLGNPRVKATESETIVVPQAGTPTQAIVQTLARLIPEASSHDRTTGLSMPTPTSSAVAPRMMVLQLTPVSLGTINVTLRLVGQSLDLTLAVSDKQTLGMIDRGRATLADAAAAQGYDLRSLVVQGSDAIQTSTGNSPTPNDSASGQTSSNADGQPSQSGHDTHRGEASKPRTNSARASDDETTRVRNLAGAGALFV